MQEREAGQEELIEGIGADARRETERILQEASKGAGERRKLAEQQSERIMQEAEEKAGKQANAIRRQAASALRMEQKRTGLRVREQVISRIEQQVRRRLQELIGTPGYREILLGWIVEAAIGLNAEKAAVNASAPEKRLLDERLLREAEGRVAELTGSRVKLSKSKHQPLLSQGVVLTAEGGRVEFNNQVSTRLLRLQSKIRKLIASELFE